MIQLAAFLLVRLLFVVSVTTSAPHFLLSGVPHVLSCQGPLQMFLGEPLHPVTPTLLAPARSTQVPFYLSTFVSPV